MGFSLRDGSSSCGGYKYQGVGILKGFFYKDDKLYPMCGDPESLRKWRV